MNGSDHLPPQPELSSMIRAANMELEGAVLEHSSLPEVFAERPCASSAIARTNGPCTMASSAAASARTCCPGVLSARMWIKQSNQDCEDLLAHWAEPFSTWADILKKQAGPEWREPLPPTTAHMPFPTSEESISALIDRAWRHLLENQPHDSICGCSVDGVHEEMRQRYEWVREIGEEIVRQSLRTIAALGPDDPLGTIAVFNPTPQPATGYVTATIPWEERSSRRPPSSRPTARASPIARLGDVASFEIPPEAPSGYDRSRADIGFVASDVPGYGYRIYRLDAGDAVPPPALPRR